MDRVQLVVPASEVLITRTRLPAAARRAAGSVLAFALEERIVSDPDANRVAWLGTADDLDVLAVIDRNGLDRWRNSLGETGIHSYEVHSEMLLSPWSAGEWSVVWDGQEGFVRTGELEATATDSGDHKSPPMSLHLMLEEAGKNGKRPLSLALYTTTENARPDLEAWQETLGISIRPGGVWDWRNAGTDAGVLLAKEAPRWLGARDMVRKLRVAGWTACIALALYSVATLVDWTSLSAEQRNLRGQMNARFRATFPDAVSVVDPALQMRRKLAEARHAAGQPDVGDFLPMIERVVSEMKDIPGGSVRILSYESGRMTLELVAMDEAAIYRLVTRLRQTGFSADSSSSSGGAGRTIITVRAS